MNTRLRALSIGMILLLSAMLPPVFGVPYGPFSALASSLLQYGESATPTPPPVATILEVEDQDVTTGMVIIQRANVGIRSWILIHNQRDGDVGDVIGRLIVLFGDNRDVVVPIELEQATPVLYASLHADWGQREVYEPELDVQTTPFIPFEVTLPAPPPEGTESTVTPAAATPTQPPDEAAPAPDAPAEGAELPVGWLGLIGAICLLGLAAGAVAGAVLFLLMRRRRR
jgi:hypothetical protein